MTLAEWVAQWVDSDDDVRKYIRGMTEHEFIRDLREQIRGGSFSEEEQQFLLCLVDSQTAIM